MYYIYEKNNLILTVAVMAAVVFNSCKKDKTVQPTKQEVSAKDKAITQKILNFKQKLFAYKEMPNAKDGQAMPVDSAVWYSEALLNYTYDEGKSLNNYTTETGAVEVPTSNGQILMTDLYAAYNELETLLASQQQENSDADLVIADISVKEENGNTFFVLTSGFGDDLGGGTPPTNIWWEDAADVIQYNINSNTPQPVDGYWTSISIVLVCPVRGYSTNNGVNWTTPPYNFRNQNDPIPGDNWWEYRMFYNYSGWPNYHLYLNPSEISFYTNKAFYICNTEMFTVLPWLIGGKDFTGMDGDHETLILPEHSVKFHWYMLSYGIAVYGGGGE